MLWRAFNLVGEFSRGVRVCVCECVFGKVLVIIRRLPFIGYSSS